MEAHITSVARISTTIKRFHEQKQPWRVYHGGSNSTRRPQYSRKAVVDTSGLTNVLKIDHETRRALVEPNVSMGRLVDATLPEGLVSAVVMEFPEITVGGGFSGNSGESSSWKNGLFDETITSIEVVLADGSVMHASESVNPDLFHGAAGGHGTLGVVTALEVQLIESKPYVQVDCYAVSSVSEASIVMRDLCNAGSCLYVDAIILSPSSGVVMSGKLASLTGISDACPLVSFDRARDQWFYRYIEKRLAKHSSKAPPHQRTSTTQPAFQFISPLRSYLFRYDRGAFWGGKYTFRYLITPFNRITRFILDPLLHAATMFRALHGSGLAAQTIVQDIGVPARNLTAFVEYLDARFGFGYWWLCPIRHRSDRRVSFALADTDDREKKGTSSSDDGAKGPWDEEMWVNVGIWGRGSTDPEGFAQDNRELEAKTHELGGLKALYARTWYTEEEFWKVYDRQPYDSVRAKYHAEGLPSLYDKVKADTRVHVDDGTWRAWWERVKMTRPLPGISGVLSLVLTRDYLFSS